MIEARQSALEDYLQTQDARRWAVVLMVETIRQKYGIPVKDTRTHYRPAEPDDPNTYYSTPEALSDVLVAAGLPVVLRTKSWVDPLTAKEILWRIANRHQLSSVQINDDFGIFCDVDDNGKVTSTYWRRDKLGLLAKKEAEAKK